MCAGSLKQLILTGLPKLQHLKVNQTVPRSPPKVAVRCKALKLPHSLRSFDLTVSAPSLMIQEQLTVLQSLPRLETVGLHGFVLESIPDLRSIVTRYACCPTCWYHRTFKGGGSGEGHCYKVHALPHLLVSLNILC